MNDRKYYLDWLKVLFVLVLVTAHAARVFDHLPFYLKQGEYLAAELYIRFLDAWFMPLFFVISGMAAAFSIQRRGFAAFRAERAKRLLVPLVFGIVTLLPLVGYVAYTNQHGNEPIGFLEYYPRFFVPDPASLEGYTGHLTPSHLWFLLYLFIYAVVSGPILRMFAANRLSGLAKRRPLLFGLLCILIAKLTLLPYPNPVYFLAYFWIGCALGTAQADFDVFRSLRERPVLIVSIAVVTMALLLGVRAYYLPDNGPGWVYFAMQPVYVTTAFLWVLIIMHYGSKIFTQSSALLRYLSEASLFVYVAHMAFVIWIGWYVIDRFAPPVAFVMMTVGTYAGLFIVYELLVKRVPLLRLAFGLGERTFPVLQNKRGDYVSRTL